VQAADLLAVIGMGKGDVGDDLVGMDADPLVQGPAILVELKPLAGFPSTLFVFS
jgi:hypothetical protein